MIQAKADGLYEFFLLELATGLRRGELAALKWNDLNLKTGELTVDKQLQRYENGIGLALITPKTPSSRRTIILPPSVLDVYKTFKETATSEWLFPSPYDPSMPVDPGVFNRRVKSILQRAECKDIRFHDLRHTFTTLALEAGMDVKTLSSILGHVSTEVSLDVYAHSTSSMQQKAAVTIDRRISKNRLLTFTPGPVQQKVEKEPFIPKAGARRKHGTGCISELNDHLFEGRYSPYVNGKKRSYNVYAKTREECEQLLAELISAVKPELEKNREYSVKPLKQRKVKVMI